MHKNAHQSVINNAKKLKMIYQAIGLNKYIKIGGILCYLKYIKYVLA